MSRAAPASQADVVILTAIALEYEAVLKVEAGAWPGSRWEEVQPSPTGLPVSFRTFQGVRGRPLRVLVALAADMASAAATRALDGLVETYQPACIAMCGVCAGHPKKTKLGDVIAAERLFFHDAGKQLPDRVQQDIKTYNLRDDWKAALEQSNFASRFHAEPWCEHRFQLHVAPIGSGNKVIEDEKYWDFVQESVRKTLGLEMEAVAVGALAHAWRARRHRPLDALVMKAVMDFGNHGRVDDFKPFAARASAECLLAFLREHLDPELIAGLDDLLDTGTEPPPPNPPPSALLTARYEVVDFEYEARADILAELNRWSDEAPAVAVRLIHAEGGAGKTRLGIEWARQRRDAWWLAGFLPASPPEDWFERLCADGRSVAVVIDYAESRQGLAKELQRALRYQRQEGAGSQRKVRILLLARNSGDWWTSLKQGDTALGNWLEATPPRELPPLAEKPVDREQLFRHAVERFAERLNKHAPAGAPPLTDPLFDRALYLHMAALAFVEGLEVAPNKLIETVLAHEERFWVSQAQAKDVTVSEHRSLARQLVAAATLRGGLEKKEARAIAERLLDRPVTREEEELLRLLQQIYQRGEGPYLPALEPDLLGEGMVLRVAEPPLKADWVDGDWIELVFPRDQHDDAVETGFTVLGRASATQPEPIRPWIDRMLSGSLLQRAPLALMAAKTVGTHTAFSVLGEVLADRLEASGDASVARALEGVGVPDATVSLHQIAEWMERTLLDASPQSNDEPSLAERARRFNNLGNRLGALGRRERACDATRQAVEIYRSLAQNKPQSFLPHLASSLTNLGMHLGSLGYWEGALEATRQAVKHYRALAEHDPDAFLPYLAASLNNCAGMLNSLERREESLDATRQALDLRRKLAARDPDSFLSDLAMSFNNLGLHLGLLGRREEALDATLQAVELRRTLAARNPDAFLPDLASSLNSLGVRLSALGRGEEALDATLQAVELHRSLAARLPDSFLPKLAGTLNNLGNRLSALGREEEALSVVEEAMDRLWPFFESTPAAFKPLLKMLLSQLVRLYEFLAKPLPPTLVDRLATFERLTQS